MNARLTTIASLLALAACNTDTDTAEVYDGPAFGTVTGAVYDMNDEPVEGVEVEIVSQGLVAVTGADGRYVLDGVSPEAGFTLAFVKDGYAKGYTRASLISWETIAANKRLMAIDGVGTFNATEGGTVIVDEVEVTFDPNTIIDEETGELYTGVVSVAITYVDPYDARELEVAPGDLQALGFEEGASKATTPTVPTQLVSYGMTDVTLTGSDGQPLNLDDGSSAAVDMSITNGDLIDWYQVADEDRIPNWSWDASTGTWMEENAGDVYTRYIDYDAEGNPIDYDALAPGEEAPEVAFTREDLRYAFDASHFSWWNCDQGFVPTCAEGRVLDVLGFPVRGARVSAIGSVTSAVAYTDEDGYYEVTVMAGDTVSFIGLTNVDSRDWTASRSKFIDGEGSDPSVCEPIEDLDIQVCREAGIIMTDNVKAELTTASGANADRMRAWFWEPPGDVQYCENPWDDISMDSCQTFDPDEFANYQPDMDGYPHELRSVGSWLDVSTSRTGYRMVEEQSNGKPFYRFVTEEITDSNVSDMTDPAQLDGLVQQNAIDFRSGDVLSAQSAGSSSFGSINESNWVTIPTEVELSGVSGPIRATAGSSLNLNWNGVGDSDGIMVFGAGDNTEAVMCRFTDDGGHSIPSSAMGAMGNGTAGLNVVRPEIGWTPGPDGLPIRVQAFSGTAVEVNFQ